MNQLKNGTISILPIILLIIFSIAVTPTQGLESQDGWKKIYEKYNGWAVEVNYTDQYVTPIMQVALDGNKSTGKVAKIRIIHKSENGRGAPQVAVIYSSGYIRLKQNADPDLSIPFGSSFILGPEYNGSNTTSKNGEYHNNPQLESLEIDTSQLPGSPLKLRAAGSNHDFSTTYDIVMPLPTDQQTRLHVDQTYRAKDNISINQTARRKLEGFKLVQFSSMFINEGGSCDGDHRDCHDSNAARYMGKALVEKGFRDLIPPSFIFDNPQPLGQLWLDLLHTDNNSWHLDFKNRTSGNTPNLRIVLDSQNNGSILIPQGRINRTNNPNDDNVGLWISDDGMASNNWTKGQEGRISYWLLAQDNPPELG